MADSVNSTAMVDGPQPLHSRRNGIARLDYTRRAISLLAEGLTRHTRPANSNRLPSGRQPYRSGPSCDRVESAALPFSRSAMKRVCSVFTP